MHLSRSDDFFNDIGQNRKSRDRSLTSTLRHQMRATLAEAGYSSLRAHAAVP